MAKPFRTIHEQLAILANRNLTIENYKQAKQYLLTNNYYNIINGYSTYFQSEQDNYFSEATFNEVTHAYLFDKEIKSVLLKTILEMEKHLVSIFAYSFSEIHPEDPDFYLKEQSYNPPSKLKKSLPYNIQRLKKLIEKHKRKKESTPINHYANKYGVVPFWVIINFLTFGEVVTLIQLIPQSVQNKIAIRFYSFISQHYSIHSKFTDSIFISFIKNISEVRNICAHDNRLWDFKCQNNVKYCPDIHDQYYIGNNDPKNDVYNVYLILRCFITPAKYNILTQTLKKRFKNFENKLTSVSINVFLNSLGFPDNWHKK